MKTVVLKREKNHQDNLEITIILAIDGNWIPFVINTPSLITQLQRMEAVNSSQSNFVDDT